MTKGKLYDVVGGMCVKTPTPLEGLERGWGRHKPVSAYLDEAKKEYLELNYYDEYIHKWFKKWFGDEK